MAALEGYMDGEFMAAFKGYMDPTKENSYVQPYGEIEGYYKRHANSVADYRLKNAEFIEKIKLIVYVIFNGLKGIFGKSDWQVTKKKIVAELLQAANEKGITLSEKGAQLRAEKFLYILIDNKVASSRQFDDAESTLRIGYSAFEKKGLKVLEDDKAPYLFVTNAMEMLAKDKMSLKEFTMLEYFRLSLKQTKLEAPESAKA